MEARLPGKVMPIGTEHPFGCYTATDYYKALSQKNSEATKALAGQKEILEKELGEIQKVLLAMQEQQQTQLELILAIGKSTKLFEDKREPIQEKDTVEACKSTEEAKQLKSIRLNLLVQARDLAMTVHKVLNAAEFVAANVINSMITVCPILQYTRHLDSHRCH